MSKKLLAVTMVVAALSIGGCATASMWWQNFKDNPAAQVQAALASVEIVKTVATATFQAIKMQLPVEKQAGAEADFQKAMLAVSKAEAALLNAVDAAAQAKETHPDFTAVFADLTAAVKKVQEIVALYKAAVPATPAMVGAAKGVAPEGYDELTKQVTALEARLKNN